MHKQERWRTNYDYQQGNFTEKINHSHFLARPVWQKRNYYGINFVPFKHAAVKKFTDKKDSPTQVNLSMMNKLKTSVHCSRKQDTKIHQIMNLSGVVLVATITVTFSCNNSHPTLFSPPLLPPPMLMFPMNVDFTAFLKSVNRH